jgi:hypothetical protein
LIFDLEGKAEYRNPQPKGIGQASGHSRLNISERMPLMDVMTIDVAAKDSINLVCAKCGNEKQITVSKLPDAGRIYKVKCKCTHVFSVAFNRRKYNRKRTNIIGSYASKHSLADNIINITDISRGGLAFVRTDTSMIAVGDKLTINFTLDNTERDSITCTALIRNILGKKVCVEFLDMRKGMQTTLGFYLM